MGMSGALDTTARQRQWILALLARYLPGVETWAFGSRVKWSSRPDSDLDIVVFAPLDQKNKVVELREAFMECSLPFRVDLHIWQELPGSFQENIKDEYVVLLEANSTLKTSAMVGEISILVGACNDKIDLNRRINRNLEEMARAIFKSWFIDFEPVQRNADGFQDHFSELFPDSFRDSELGRVPRGWDVGSIADFATSPGPIEYIDPSKVELANIDRVQRELRPGDIVIRKVLAGNSYTLILTEGVTGSGRCVVLRPRRPDDALFVYLRVTTPGNIEELTYLADGGVYLAVRPENVVAVKIIRPSDKVIAKFSMLTKPMFTKMVQNQHQSAALAEMRDTLLRL